MANHIKIPLPELTGYQSRWKQDLAMTERASHLWRLGYTVEEWCDNQYVVFDTWEEAVIFKLTYL